MRSVGCQRGFTLVELIMVIVIMGIIGGMVSVFMKSPIDAYIASGRRAAMTDVADTVVRRMARDIQRALPNSINTSGDNLCVEFIPTRTGGRYRVEEIEAGDGSSLVFGAPDQRFYMLGDNSALPTDQRIAANDVIAVLNFGFDVGDAYAGGGGSNTMVVSTATRVASTGINGTQTAIVATAPTTFNLALASPNNRFQVIPSNETVVAYVCSSDNNLYRVFNTTRAHICPASPAVVTTGFPILARNATCHFVYSGPDLQRNALVSMVLTIQDSSGETVSLQHEVHVSNTP